MRYQDYKIPLSLLTKDQQVKLDTANTKATEATGSPRYHISCEGETEGKEVTPDSAVTTSLTRFVNLVDVLPPLPTKGQFDVSTIKKSLYFFS